MKMLTKKQFKILMILFDDHGHAGWQLAEALGMEESNLNPLLKRLEKLNFIFQGLPRKSNRPKKPKEYKKSKNVEKVAEIEKKEGDYKEFPYYLNKDLNVLMSIIKELIITNETYDIGFPYRIIRASNYMQSMKKIFNEEFNEFLVNLFKELNIRELGSCPSPGFSGMTDLKTCAKAKLNELHLLSFKEEELTAENVQVSKESLKELEIWWFRYELGMCICEDPINYYILLNKINCVPWNYTIGDDIIEAIIIAVNKLSALQKRRFFDRDILLYLTKNLVCV
jgi:DNA-binding Lrp family transcriptional regulator